MSDAVIGLTAMALFVVAVVVFGKVVVKWALIAVLVIAVAYVIVKLGLWDDIRESGSSLIRGVRTFIETGTGETIG